VAYLLTISSQSRKRRYTSLKSNQRCRWPGTTCHRDRSTRRL